MPHNLDAEQINVLTAFAENVVGIDAFTRVPNLIEEIDDFIDELSSSAKDDLNRSLNYLGSDLFMGFLRLVTGVDVEFESFDELDVRERQEFLDALERSDDADMRTLYLSLTGLVTTVFHEASANAESGDDRSVPYPPVSLHEPPRE